MADRTKGLTLVSASRDDRGALVLNYEGRHSRDYKTLEFKIVLKQDPPPGVVSGRPMGDAFEATIQFDGCLGKTPRETLVRLAEWCRRASVAIHRFNPQVQVPG